MGDDALIEVVRYWKYDAFVRAANAMIRRNPARLSFELWKMDPPNDRKFYYGLFLARCGNRKGVPALCETVRDYQIIDGEAFDLIAAVGGIEDRELVERLPATVRADQVDQAVASVRRYKLRAFPLSPLDPLLRVSSR
jgi:hypothetical protein